MDLIYLIDLVRVRVRVLSYSCLCIYINTVRFIELITSPWDADDFCSSFGMKTVLWPANGMNGEAALLLRREARRCLNGVLGR